MRRQLVISADPIDESGLVAKRSISTAAGAVVWFSGVVRAEEEGAPIAGLEYEVFQKMAERQFERLFDEMENRWPVESVRLVHRVGPVKANETSLWVEIAAPHRGEAFAACQWLIDELKRVVPIWKKPIARTQVTLDRLVPPARARRHDAAPSRETPRPAPPDPAAATDRAPLAVRTRPKPPRAPSRSRGTPRG